MKKGCTLLCMAHFHSFPDRAKMLEDSNINVIAMEEILESPTETSEGELIKFYKCSYCGFKERRAFRVARLKSTAGNEPSVIPS